MIATLTRERRKIQRNLEGIRRMNKLPAALVIIDVRREHIGAREARKLHIPVVSLIDTDSDPDYVDIPIPGNDDAMRAIELVLNALGDAVEEGKRAQPEAAADGAAGERGPRPPRRSSRVVARADEGPQPATEDADLPAPAAPSDQDSSSPADKPPADSPVAST